MPRADASVSPPIDVVITGMGAVTPIGIGVGEFWRGITERRCGIAVRDSLATTESPFRIGGIVRDFDGKLFVKPRKSLKVMCPQIQFGYAAAQMAVEQAQLAPGSSDPDRLGTLFASETFYADADEVAAVFHKCIVDGTYHHERWGESAMREIMPLWMLKYLPNMVASHVSIVCDARGPSNTICQAEVSGHLALIEAIDWIRRGAADQVIVGGTGSPMEVTSLLYRGWQSLSRRWDEPTAAMRPFDRDRDGPVLGEGAAAVVLERGEVAAARGVAPLARLTAYDRGFRQPGAAEFDAALARSIQAALSRAGRQPDEVAFATAHAMSDPQGDAVEARAIRSSLAETPVWAPKSYYGNLGPGGSLVELIASVMALRERIVPATLNLDHLDPACPVNASPEARPLVPSQTAVLLNHATTGQFATLVLEATE